MTRERLDKLLVHMNLGSRTEIKALVKAGRVAVDGVAATDPGLHVDPEVQRVALDGEPVAYRRHFYILLNKPAGVITTTEISNRPTVMDVLPPALRHRGLFPVGRLDKETEGLLLFTTDGELCHRLLSPKWHVEKRYLVRVDQPLETDDPIAFATGILLEDGYTCLPARLDLLDSHTALVTVQEGKYHQVRRMFQARRKRVIYLQRLAIGPLQLGDLPLAQARSLTDQEIAILYDVTGLAHA